MIKLFSIGILPSGVERLQSQLLIGSDTADFIKEKDVVKCWGYGRNGFDFYDYKSPYLIVNDINEMKKQVL